MYKKSKDFDSKIAENQINSGQIQWNSQDAFSKNPWKLNAYHTRVKRINAHTMDWNILQNE